VSAAAEHDEEVCGFARVTAAMADGFAASWGEDEAGAKEDGSCGYGRQDREEKECAEHGRYGYAIGGVSGLEGRRCLYHAVKEIWEMDDVKQKEELQANGKLP
jgi:hypothetical protein